MSKVSGMDRPRTKLKVSIFYCALKSCADDFIPISELGIIVVRDGNLWGRPVMLAYALKPPKIISGRVHLGQEQPGDRRVAATFISGDGGKTWPNLDPLHHELGRKINRAIALHLKQASFASASHVPLPELWAGYRGDPCPFLDERAVADALLDVALGIDGPLLQEQAPADGYAKPGRSTEGLPEIAFEHPDGFTDHWSFPRSAKLLLPGAGKAVVKGEVIAQALGHFASRMPVFQRGNTENTPLRWWVESATRECRDGPILPVWCLATENLPPDCHYWAPTTPITHHVTLSPSALYGSKGIVHFNLLSNHRDMRLPDGRMGTVQAYRRKVPA